MKTCVITGINGFVGKHLARELHQNNCAVIGVSYEDTPNPALESIIDSYHQADLSQQWPSLPDADAIIHLAGLAAVGPSFDQPQKYITANSAMVTNMCEHYVERTTKPRIILVSSGAIYDSAQTMPLCEESSIGYNSPYAVSKILNENQAAYYRSRGLDMVVARPFNHIGPGQLPGFLVPDLVQQLNEAKQDKSPLKVGNLTTRRDYTDVRDVAMAYRLLATTPRLHHLIYNVCSGKSISGQEILEHLQDILNAKEIDIEIDKSKIRPNDPADIFGSAGKLFQDTGWKSVISLTQTLKDISV